jgi:hypothetical protein
LDQLDGGIADIFACRRLSEMNLLCNSRLGPRPSPCLPPPVVITFCALNTVPFPHLFLI